MKYTQTFFVAFGVFAALFLSSASFAGEATYWVVGDNGELQPVEKHFFDLHTPTATETSAVTSTHGTTSTTSGSITAGAELTEEDQKDLVKEEDAPDVDLNAPVDIEDLSEEEQLEAAEAAIKNKVVEKYKIQVNEIIERLIAKVGTVPDEERAEILENMQAKVSRKKTNVIKSDTIDALRKEILIEILDYIVQSLEPTGSKESTLLNTDTTTE